MVGRGGPLVKALDNPSAPRFFRPERHGPEQGAGKKVAREETDLVSGALVYAEPSVSGAHRDGRGAGMRTAPRHHVEGP